MSEYLFKSLIVFILLLYASCGRTEKQNTPTVGEGSAEKELIRITSSQFKENQMQLGRFSELVFREKIQVTGTIDVPPQNKAVVTMPVGGYVKHTNLLVGDKVRKGQALVTLENPEFVQLQQNYLEVKAQIRYLEAEFSRHQKLYEENITSQKNLLKAESDFKTAQATLLGLGQQLRMLHIATEELEAGHLTSLSRIYAPIDGSISKMNITKGAFISPATEIMEIINTEHIHLELLVFEKDIANLKEGQPIIFSIPEVSNEQFKGEVHRLGSSIDENRRILVHGHIENTSSFNFLKGMFVNAEIITDSIKRQALPESSVVEAGNQYFVLKLLNEAGGNYVFEPMSVNVYEKESGFIAIGTETKLKPEDQYLTSGGFSLISDY
ncbi:MAG: efflux RND transporter periplasmic adaptor subunit [Flavobacteriaceae bacterium]